MNMTRAELNRLRKTMPTRQFDLLEQSLKVRAENEHLRQTEGPCPRTAENGTPCTLYTGHLGPCFPSGGRGPATDNWVVKNKDGTPLCQVVGQTQEEARREAMKCPDVRAASRADGGVSMRRLGEDELPDPQ